MKTALVTGAGGFIAGHLVEYLKKQGYWVRGVDIKNPEYRSLSCDEFKLLDLRIPQNCDLAMLNPFWKPYDEIYSLAADMGGMGFIHSAETDIMRNNVLINVNMIHAACTANYGVPGVPGRYFYSSSVCVYRDMKIGEPEMNEVQAYPAMPHNEYGFEKLYSERVVEAYGRKYNISVRIARFQNCYGPYGTWKGGREKAPAALCRKIAEIKGNKGTIDVWGDGTAVRSYTYVEDMVEGIYRLMHSDLKGPTNIGNPEYVSVDELAYTIAKIANKDIIINHIDGPVGVQSRNFSNNKIYSTGWKSQWPLVRGIEPTYKWIEEQVKNNV